MFFYKIYYNLSLLIKRKIGLKDIPRKIFKQIYNFRIIRNLKKNRFPINEVSCVSIAHEDKGKFQKFLDMLHFQGFRMQDGGDEIIENFVDRLSPEFFCYVAKYKDEILGGICLNKAWKEFGIDDLVISSFTVIEKYRCYGIGEKLLISIISAIKDKAGISLRTHKFNSRAINLYKKLGFRRNEELRDKIIAYLKNENNQRLVLRYKSQIVMSKYFAT